MPKFKAMDTIERFREDGIVLLDGLLSGTTIDAFREVALSRCERQPYVFGQELFLSYPEAVLSLIANNSVLDFCDAIFGPYYQLDSFSVVGIPAGSSLGISWHRDIFGSVPRGTTFQRPMALNLLVYLQNLTNQVGPLRVLPKSHRRPMTIPDSRRSTPHPEEVLHFPKRGDGVLIHNNLVHSRSQNQSPHDRIHLSVVYSLSCMRQTIDTSAPALANIVRAVRAVGDPRLLRLFGFDPNYRDKYNSGSVANEKKEWARWLLRERAM